MLKFPSISLYSYGNILHCCASYHSPFHCPVFASYGHNQSLHIPCRSSGQYKPQQHNHAEFSTKNAPSDQSADLHWPKLSSSAAIPTPYQIFQLSKDAPYSKRRFYELVKLYHPDRHSCEQRSTDNHSTLSHVRVERYRLVVAANNILSDPAKRRAYDINGAGWDGCFEFDTPKYGSRHYGGSRWSGFDANSSPARNATWEDWERWYNRGIKTKQAQVFNSNKDFLYIVLICMALVGIGQVARLEDQARSISQRVEAVYDSCNQDIQSRRKTSHNSENRHERVQGFLENRDLYGQEISHSRKENSRNPFPQSEP